MSEYSRLSSRGNSQRHLVLVWENHSLNAGHKSSGKFSVPILYTFYHKSMQEKMFSTTPPGKDDWKLASKFLYVFFLCWQICGVSLKWHIIWELSWVLPKITYSEIRLKDPHSEICLSSNLRGNECAKNSPNPEQSFCVGWHTEESLVQDGHVGNNFQNYPLTRIGFCQKGELNWLPASRSSHYRQESGKMQI